MRLKDILTLYVDVIASQHFTKFGGHRLCDSRDITYLILHVTLQDNVIKGSCDSMEGSPSLYVATLPSLVVIAIAVVNI